MIIRFQYIYDYATQNGTDKKSIQMQVYGKLADNSSLNTKYKLSHLEKSCI